MDGSSFFPNTVKFHVFIASTPQTIRCYSILIFLQIPDDLARTDTMCNRVTLNLLSIIVMTYCLESRTLFVTRPFSMYKASGPLH